MGCESVLRSGEGETEPHRRDQRRPARRQSNRAKRMECVELAPAFADPSRSIAGASSTHSIRFARSAARKILATCEQVGRLQSEGACSVAFPAFLRYFAV